MDTQKLIIGLLSVFFSFPALAQTSATEGTGADFGFRLNFESIYDENATRLPDDLEQSQVEERQDRYSIDLTGQYNGQSTKFTADYNIARNVYNKSSQEDATTRVGNALLFLGDELSRYDLELEHNARRVLVNPEDELVIENTRKQDVYTVVPSIKTRADKPTSMKLSALLNRVEFENEASDNSKTRGTQLMVTHRLSKLRAISILGSSRYTDFEAGDDDDYNYRLYAVQFSSISRVTDFALNVGYNEVLPENRSNNHGVYYSVEGSFDYDLAQISFEASQQYSDSSNNSGVDIVDSNIVSSGASNVTDQLELTTFDLGLATQSICSACTLSVSYSRQNLEYQNIVEENVVNSTMSVSGEYRRTRKLIFNLSYVHQKADFELDFPDRNSETKISQAGATYLWNDRLSIRALYKVIRRDDSTNGYDSKILGLGFSIGLK